MMRTRLKAKEYRTRPHELGMRAGFDPVRLGRLVDELETDARLEREAELRERRRYRGNDRSPGSTPSGSGVRAVFIAIASIW